MPSWSKSPAVVGAAVCLSSCEPLPVRLDATGTVGAKPGVQRKPISLRQIAVQGRQDARSGRALQRKMIVIGRTGVALPGQGDTVASLHAEFGQDGL
jgi:hypothetical protein